MNKFGVAALLLLSGFILGFGVRTLLVVSESAEVDLPLNDSEPLNSVTSTEQQQVSSPISHQELNLHQAKVLIAQMKGKLSESEHQAQQIETLQRQVKTLEQQLNQRMAQQADQLWLNGDAKSDMPELKPLSANQVQQYLPKPFDSFYDVANENLVRRVNQFVNEAIEPDFAELTSLKIADFISLHQYGYAIEVKSITCKATSCLLTMVELEADSWQRIYNDMQLQSWWMFKHSSLSFQGSNDKALLLQLLSTQ